MIIAFLAKTYKHNTKPQKTVIIRLLLSVNATQWHRQEEIENDFARKAFTNKKRKLKLGLAQFESCSKCGSRMSIDVVLQRK
jgi:hypothetical protein